MHERILFPGIAALLVSTTAPQIHNLLTFVVDHTRRAKLAAFEKVARKLGLHLFKCWRDIALHDNVLPAAP